MRRRHVSTRTLIRALAVLAAVVPAGCIPSEKSRYEAHLSTVVPRSTRSRDGRSLAARDGEAPALSVLPDETRQ